jgi:hypothetical protein
MERYCFSTSEELKKEFTQYTPPSPTYPMHVHVPDLFFLRCTQVKPKGNHMKLDIGGVNAVGDLFDRNLGTTHMWVIC